MFTFFNLQKKKNVLTSTFLILLVFDCELFPFLCFHSFLFIFYISTVSYAKSVLYGREATVSVVAPAGSFSGVLR